MPPRINTDAELDAFDALFVRLGGFDDSINSEWADGFFTACAVAPVALSLDAQIAAACGDAFARCISDPEDGRLARATIDARVRALVSHLDAQSIIDDLETLRMHPLMVHWDDERRAELVALGTADAELAKTAVTGSMWAEGFLDGAVTLEEIGEVWQLPADDEAMAVYDDMILQVRALKLADGSEELAAHIAQHYGDVAPTRDELIDEACAAVQGLRIWWLDFGPKPAPRHVEATPGRNEPCPCGSGKKFKKCHGAQ